MKKTIYTLFIAAICMAGCQSETMESGSWQDQSMELAVHQYKLMKDSLSGDEFPRSFEDGKFITSDSGWWCSGFYPGTLLYLYEQTGDTVLLNEAERIMGHLEREQYNTYTHDLGFMMFDSFGNALNIAPKPEYEEILINSAKSLATRYSPEVKAIRSWDSDDDEYLVIIDNMMNLELLFWATETTGDSTYYDIAVTHANTTIENHFREDNSSWHVLNYDPETGDIQEKRTAQGLSDESAWARGQAWGLYGFTSTFISTGDSTYLAQAEKIADFMLNHPNLPEDHIPLWDFNAEPDAKRDASAAAIMASALLELDKYIPGKNYAEIGESIIEKLAADYTADRGTNGGFILKHSVGHLPADSEVDVPLTYADYYFVEGLMRLKENEVAFSYNP